MFSGFIAAILMAAGLVSKEPSYFIAAGLYNLADILYVHFNSNRR